VTTDSRKIHLYPMLLENTARFELSPESLTDYFRGIEVA
jgi:hypothetical protein